MPRIYEAMRTLPGIARSAHRIHESVERCRIYIRHRAKRRTNADIRIEKKDRQGFFRSAPAEDAEHFELVKGGWEKDHRLICRWV